MGIGMVQSGRADSIEMVLHTIAGHEKVLALESGMSVSLDKDRSVLSITNANDSTLFEYFLSYIASISYRGDIPESTGIGEVSEGKGVKYTLTKEGISLQGLSPKTRILIYAPNGQLLRRMRALENGCAIQKADLPKGVVLVKINDEVIKIMNR